MGRTTPQPQGFRAYLGAAIQKQRLQRGMTQGQLAEAANLSLKYVGEVERGEANTTIGTIERLAEVLDWNPATTLDGREPITEAVRVMLIGETEQICCRLESMTTWLRAIDPAPHNGGLHPSGEGRLTLNAAQRPRARMRSGVTKARHSR